MPPKRKNKAATKAGRVTSHLKSQPPAGAIRTSSHLADFEDHHLRPAKRNRVSTDSGLPPNHMDSEPQQHQVVDAEEDGTSSRTVSNSPTSVSNKRRRPSDDSGMTTKTATPNGRVRSESDLSEKPPSRKKRKTAAIETPDDSAADAAPELTDASTPPGSPEQQLSQPAHAQALKNALLPTINGETVAKPSRRLPGRKRREHSNLEIEVRLRRQLELKMNYRIIAKIQKGILEELSKRTLQNLEANEHYHEECPEHVQVMAELDQHYQERMKQLNAERKQKLDQLERVRVAEERIQKEQYINRFREFQDNFMLQALYRMKQMERQIRAEQSGYATDDDEHIVEPTHPQFPVHGPDDRLGSKYASRSRAYVETERMLDLEERREKFDELRKTFLAVNPDCDDSIEDDIPEDFASFTGPDRAEALAHFNVDNLIDAAAEVERADNAPKPPKIVSNEEASALFLLASLSAEAPAQEPPESQQGDSIIPSASTSVAPTPLPSGIQSAVQSAVPSRIHSAVSSRVGTPAQHIDRPRQAPSPFAPPPADTDAVPTESSECTGNNQSVDAHEPPAVVATQPVTNGLVAEQLLKPKSPVPEPAPRKPLNRITDLLNDILDEQESILRSPKRQVPEVEPQQPSHPTPSQSEGIPKNVPASEDAGEAMDIDETPAQNDTTGISNTLQPPGIQQPAQTTAHEPPRPRLPTIKSEPEDDPNIMAPSANPESKPSEGGPKSLPPHADRHPLERLKAMVDKRKELARRAREKEEQDRVEEERWKQEEKERRRLECERLARKFDALYPMKPKGPPRPQSQPQVLKAAPPTPASEKEPEGVNSVDPTPAVPVVVEPIERTKSAPQVPQVQSEPPASAPSPSPTPAPTLPSVEVNLEPSQKERDQPPEAVRSKSPVPHEASRSADAHVNCPEASPSPFFVPGDDTYDYSLRHDTVESMAPTTLTRAFSPQPTPSLSQGPDSRANAKGKAPAVRSPSLSRPLSTSPSISGGYAQLASPSGASSPYRRSPRDCPIVDYPPRRTSYDHPDRRAWARERRGSASYASSGSPDLHRRSAHLESRHHHTSPYLPSNPHLPNRPPTGPNTLPPRPPVPPSQSPINFRFAHYDPAPSSHARPGPHYPQLVNGPPAPPPSSQPTASYPPRLPPVHIPMAPLIPPQHGYVPPQGSFQAPPPPSQPYVQKPIQNALPPRGGGMHLASNQYPPAAPAYRVPPPGPRGASSQGHGNSHGHGHYEHHFPHELRNDHRSEHRGEHRGGHRSEHRDHRDRGHRRRNHYSSRYAPPGTEFRPYAGPNHRGHGRPRA